MAEKTQYSITISSKSLKRMKEVFDKIKDIDKIDIYHHVKIGTKKEFEIMKDVGKNYEKNA